MAVISFMSPYQLSAIICGTASATMPINVSILVSSRDMRSSKLELEAPTPPPETTSVLVGASLVKLGRVRLDSRRCRGHRRVYGG